MLIKVKLTAAISCCLLACLALQAQRAARLEADSMWVETGNPWVLHLSLTSDKTPDSLNFNPWQAFFSPKNLLAQSPWKRQGDRLTTDITLIFFDADTLLLPPLPLTFQNADTLLTNPLELLVYATPASEDLNDMAPIKDIQREKTLWTDHVPLVAAILGGLLVLGLLFWWYARSEKSRAKNRMVSQPAHELALKKLAVLEQKALWLHGGVKEHCAELTFILREYLEKRYQVPALESTSYELLALLSRTDFPLECKADLENILSQADLAKFAKAIPANDFYPYSLDFAQVLVKRTMQPLSTADAEPIQTPT